MPNAVERSLLPLQSHAPPQGIPLVPQSGPLLQSDFLLLTFAVTSNTSKMVVFCPSGAGASLLSGLANHDSMRLPPPQGQSNDVILSERQPQSKDPYSLFLPSELGATSYELRAWS